MDKIIQGLFKSTHSDKVKKQVFKKMRLSASSSIASLTSDQQRNLLEVCIHYISFGTDFDHQEGILLLQSYLPTCNQECFDIFSDEFFGNIVLGKHISEFSKAETENTSSLLTINIARRIVLIGLLLQVFKKKKMGKQQMCIQVHIKTEAIRLLYDCLDHRTFALLCAFLLKNLDCIPSPSRFFALCTVSINAMSDFYPLETDLETVAGYVSDIKEIAHLLQFIWSNEPATLMPSLIEIFNLISSNKGNSPPSNALGCLVEYIPARIIQDVISKIVHDPTISDTQMVTALTRMISWVGWPGATQAHLWVLNFFQQLENLTKFSILIEVTVKTIKQVFFCLRFPHTRSSSISVLLHMLLSYQSTGEAFHMIVPFIPQMIAEIENENHTEANQSFLLQLANVSHCMMYLHSGFPELYGPILESLKKYPTPSKKNIKDALKYNTWSTLHYPRVFEQQLSSRSQETGRAGLVNLGNTCYMNSVIQSLFMIREFRCSVLKLTPSIGSVMHSVIETFSYLLMTQREAFEPQKLLEVSRPSWFSAGSQQDCSEYLKHLLDCLNEEEKQLCRNTRAPLSLNQDSRSSSSNQQDTDMELSEVVTARSSMIEELFHGKLRSRIQCSSCNYRSSTDETFVDIGLPLNKAEERGGITAAQNIQDPIAVNEHLQAASSSPKSRTFVDESAPDEERRPVQVEEEDEEEVAHRTHKLDDLLRESLADEYMGGDNQYHCMQCGVLRDAVKTTSITSLPKYLVLTLLRFTYSLAEQRRSKVPDNVEIAEEIKVPLHGDNPEQPELVTYRLSSVVVHSGMSAESGHYYCYAKENEEGSSTWCLFNDSHVSLSTFKSLNNLTDQFSRDTAYVLFYAKANIDFQNLDGRELIPKNLYKTIEDDNVAFIKEKEEAAKKSSNQNKSAPANVLGWNDDNPPPPPTCGGGDGQMSSGHLVC